MANASRNGSGVFEREYDWTDDAANSIPITASRFDEEMDGVAAEITNSLALDGQSTMAAALAMGGFRITNLAAATEDTDAPQVKQIQNNSFQYLGTTAGTSSDYTLSPSPSVAALVTGQEFSFTPNADNTLDGGGDTTLAISGLAATDIKKIDSSGTKASLAAGDIKNGVTVGVRYDGTDFQLLDFKETAATPSATVDAEGTVELATQAEVKAESATRVSTAANMLYHPGVQKAWVSLTGSGTAIIKSDYNVSSIIDNGTGDYTVNFDSNFLNVNYSFTFGTEAGSGSTLVATVDQGTIAVSSINIEVKTNTATPEFSDPTTLCAQFTGDL